MTKAELERELVEADQLARMGHRASYWRGYAQGLRWVAEGKASEEAQRPFLLLAQGSEGKRRDTGLGYLAGVERARRGSSSA